MLKNALFGLMCAKFVWVEAVHKKTPFPLTKTEFCMMKVSTLFLFGFLVKMTFISVHELIHTSCRINQLHLTGIKGMGSI